jgi:signal transduction histidine kinase
MARAVTGQRNTEHMTTRLFWLLRATAFVVIGGLALAKPPHSADQRAVQIACFTVVGAALVVCTLTEALPRFPAWVQPVALGVMATAAGTVVVTDGDGQSLVAFAGVAAIMAGTDLGEASAIAVASAGILPILIVGSLVGSGLGTLAGYPLLVVACLLTGRNRRGYRIQAEQSAALLEQHKQIQAEQRRADVLDERNRIAREIHDVLAHSLGALGIQIQAAKAMLTDHRDIDHAVEALTTAQRMAADGLTETRRAVHALRVDTLPLADELKDVVETHRQRYRVPVTFETSGTSRPLPPDASLALLRAGQEALVNAAKHASGQPVEVSLDYADDVVRLTVVNHDADGAARDEAKGPTSAGGYGLTGMRERLRLLNGTLQAGPCDDEWVVTAELPLAPEDVTAQ